VATLFLLHGYYDHMGLYRHVIEWALEQGFVVISCDLPGHGLSSGERASIDDFAVYQQALEALFEQARQLELPHPWHLCGQSTGGAIVVDHLHCAEQSPADGQVILLAPLVRPRAWGWSKLSYRVLRHFVNGIERRFSENTNDPAFLPFLEADPLQPRRLPTAWVGALIVGQGASRPRRELAAAVDRAGGGGWHGGLALQPQGAQGQVRRAADPDAARGPAPPGQ
jgi:alpha-beta hydrolase superfamily lysophospholipase